MRLENESPRAVDPRVAANTKRFHVIHNFRGGRIEVLTLRARLPSEASKSTWPTFSMTDEVINGPDWRGESIP
jgi:hypothetical protein